MSLLVTRGDGGPNEDGIHNLAAHPQPIFPAQCGNSSNDRAVAEPH